jgi:hypothetical protein
MPGGEVLRQQIVKTADGFSKGNRSYGRQTPDREAKQA